jgi:uncharacterized coiled-coil protein SlyX
MTLEELQTAITQTRQQIEQLKKQIEETEDFKGKTQAITPGEGAAMRDRLRPKAPISNHA